MLILESIQNSGYLDYQAAVTNAVLQYTCDLRLPMVPGDSLVVTLRDDITPNDVTNEGVTLPRPITPITHVYTFRYKGTLWERLHWWLIRHTMLTPRKEAQ